MHEKNRPAAPSTFQKKKKSQEAYLEDGGGHEDSGDTVVVVGVDSARTHAPFVTVDGLPELAGALASKQRQYVYLVRVKQSKLGIYLAELEDLAVMVREHGVVEVALRSNRIVVQVSRLLLRRTYVELYRVCLL